MNITTIKALVVDKSIRLSLIRAKLEPSALSTVQSTNVFLIELAFEKNVTVFKN